MTRVEETYLQILCVLMAAAIAVLTLQMVYEMPEPRSPQGDREVLMTPAPTVTPNIEFFPEGR